MGLKDGRECIAAPLLLTLYVTEIHCISYGFFICKLKLTLMCHKLLPSFPLPFYCPFVPPPSNVLNAYYVPANTLGARGTEKNEKSL